MLRLVASEGVIAEGHLIPARDTTLSFQGAGTVTEVKAKTSEKVKKGDVLARLGGVSDAAYAAAQLELVNAQQALKDLQENADASRAQSLIDLDNAQEAYDKAVDYYDSLFKAYKYDELVFRRVVTPLGVKRIPEIKTRKVKKADEETIAEAKNDMDLKLAKLESAQRAAERVKDGPDMDQLALLQARLKAAETGVAAFSIIAPFDGVVTEVNVAEGEQVNPQIWAVKLADTTSWDVETSDVTELEVVNIQEGQNGFLHGGCAARCNHERRCDRDQPVILYAERRRDLYGEDPGERSRSPCTLGHDRRGRLPGTGLTSKLEDQNIGTTTGY